MERKRFREDDDDNNNDNDDQVDYKHYKYGRYSSNNQQQEDYYHNRKSTTQSSSSSSSSSTSTISTIVAQHYNSINNNDIQQRKKSRIYFMRNFNNWIKSIIIRDTIKLLRSERLSSSGESSSNNNQFIVHDLGCGKGGDLTKFEKSNITYLVGTDIASVSIEHCKERYNNSRKQFDAEFINMDCTRQLIKDKLSDKNMKFDMTSCQFSFHYCFESYEQVKTMVQNASECLKIGGIFCGTIPDSLEVMKRLKQCGDNHYGNDVYTINFDKTYQQMISDGIPLFGSKYNFVLDQVVNCPEFLVYFPVLEEICESFGLKLIFKKRFDEFFEENRLGDDNSNLLNFMEALEKYPPKDRECTMGKPTDYGHVREYLMEKCSNQKFSSLGTLSKSEWEAVTLYLVFSFRKIS